MKKVIGFDMTETISKYPEQCCMLAESLRKDGWKIIIISPNPINELNADIDKYGMRPFIDDIVNRGDKGRVCAEYDVAVFLDDNDGYLKQVFDREISTMPLQVLRK